MIIYPDKPWEDGQDFRLFSPDGTYIVGTYNLPKNAWSLPACPP